jgi:Holliday junction resolvase RusA-like endonuclease
MTLRSSCWRAVLKIVLTETHVTARVVGTPSPACRPRVTRFGTYYAKAYETWMADCQKQMAVQIDPAVLALQDGIWCAVEIIVTKPRTGKLMLPRGDIDNYVKGVLDGGTKAGIWGDDVAVEFLLATKRYARPGEEPGAIINAGVLR